MDTDTFTYQILHSKTYSLSSGQTITVYVDGLDPNTCSAAILPIGDIVYLSGGLQSVVSAVPYVKVSSGTVTISPRNPSPSSSATKLDFRLLVMRYK